MEAFNARAPGADRIMQMGNAPIFLNSYCQSALEQGIKPSTAPVGDESIQNKSILSEPSISLKQGEVEDQTKILWVV